MTNTNIITGNCSTFPIKRVSWVLVVVLSALTLLGFFLRFVPKANNLVDMLMIGISLIVFLAILKNNIYINSDQSLPAIIIALFTFSFVISFFTNSRVNSIVQYALYMAYLTPLLLVRNVSSETAYKLLLPLLLFIGAIQLPFDLLFPRTAEDILDAFSGTFSMANNKSRFLFMMLLTSIIIYKNTKKKYKVALFLIIISMAWSLFLGSSLFVYLFGMASIVLGIFYRNKIYALLCAILFISAIVTIFIQYSDEPVIYWTYNRYFDSEHGVFAIIKYAWKMLHDTYLLGGGLGEFVTRTSQTLNGLYVKSVPRTMITFPIIYEKTVAPYGLPSYISIIAEAGVIGIIISALLIYYLFKNSHKSFLGFSLFVFIFLLTLYMPMFFESPDGAVFMYTYLLINRAIPYMNSSQEAA